MNNTTTIAASLVGATAITYIRDVAVKQPTTFQPLLGMFYLGTGLFAIGMWSSDVAKYLAFLVLITSIVLNGAPVFGVVKKVMA